MKDIFPLPSGLPRTVALLLTVGALVGLAAISRMAPAPAPSTVSPTPVAQAEPTPWLRAYADLPGDAFAAAPADEGAGLDLYVKFGIVLVLLVLTLQGLKRWSQGRRLPGGLGGSINVMETAYLAPNRALHLVQVGSQLVLLGATPTSITYLTALEAEAIAGTATAPAPVGGARQAGGLWADETPMSFGETLTSITAQPGVAQSDQAPARMDQIRQRMAQIRGAFTHDTTK